MFKEIITKLIGNNVLMGIGKIALISTVGITTATTGAYLYGNITDTLSNSDKVETDTSSLLVTDETETNQVAADILVDDTETSSSKSNELNETSNLNEFVLDIVTGASKIITGSVNGFVSSNSATDVNTSSSKQSSTTTIGTNPTPIEDTNTGSSRVVSVGGTLVYLDDEDEDENEYEEVEYEDEDEDKYSEEDEDDQDDEDEHEDEDEEDAD